MARKTEDRFKPESNPLVDVKYFYGRFRFMENLFITLLSVFLRNPETQDRLFEVLRENIDRFSNDNGDAEIVKGLKDGLDLLCEDVKNDHTNEHTNDGLKLAHHNDVIKNAGQIAALVCIMHWVLSSLTSNNERDHVLTDIKESATFTFSRSDNESMTPEEIDVIKSAIDSVFSNMHNHRD